MFSLNCSVKFLKIKITTLSPIPIFQNLYVPQHQFPQIQKLKVVKKNYININYANNFNDSPVRLNKNIQESSGNSYLVSKWRIFILQHRKRQKQ